MNRTPREQLVTEIHGRGVRLVLAVTGGGSSAISELLRVAGASRTVLAGAVPYASAALSEWLGGAPDEFCSPATARAMAMAAYLKAGEYDANAKICGVACTASLASDRPKRGAHRAHLAWQSATTTARASIELEKGRRTRAGEEDLVCDLMLNLVAEACGAESRLTLSLADHERVETGRTVADAGHQDLLAGRITALPLGTAAGVGKPRAVFPGAFHPLHDAHRAMKRLAAEILGCDVAYEISIANVDKPPLDFMEMDTRARQFAAGEALWLTRAPLYVQKADLFPGATFVVGADTIARIGQPRYYGSEGAMETAIEEMASRGCRFLVFGRKIEGRFCTASEIGLPKTLATLCIEVPEDGFHDDTSSTALRRRGL